MVIYFGAGQPAFRTVTVPDGARAHIDIIDAWNMTIERVPGTHEGKVRVELPARPYTAIRIVPDPAVSTDD